MQTRVDAAMCMSFATMKSQSVPCSPWWDAIKDVGNLMFPEDDVNTVRPCTTRWDEVREELKRASLGSEIGRRMFAGVSRQLGENGASSMVQTAVDSMSGQRLVEELAQKVHKTLMTDLQNARMDTRITFTRQRCTRSWTDSVCKKNRGQTSLRWQ